MLSLDRRRALGLWLFVAALAGLALYLNSVAYALSDREGDALMLFEVSGTLGYVGPVMPLLAALPFATGFAHDWQAGYAGQVMMRAGKKRYLCSKLLACALSGGLATSGGMLLFILFAHLKFPSPFLEPSFMELTGLHALLAGGGAGAYGLYYLVRLCLLFLAGAFWALTALAFSAFYPNVPLALCAPMVLYRLAGEAGNFSQIPNWLNLTLLDDGSAGLGAPAAVGAALGVFGALGALCALLFLWRAGRRLGNDA